MKRSVIFLLCAALLCGCVPGTAVRQEAVFAFTDDTGALVTLSKKPETVAVLLSSLADIWCTAGGRVDITVGESVARGFAGADTVLVDDGAGKTINTELLIAAQPDLVIYSADLAGQLRCATVLRDAGIPAAGFRVESLEDYLRVLALCTQLLDTPEHYARYGLEVKARSETVIAQSLAKQHKPDILFVRAGSSARYTKAKIAENHFVCAMLRELGSNNIAESAAILLDGLSTEEILRADPDIIFYTTMGEEADGSAYMESLLSDPSWQTLTAVRTGQVYQLPKDLFQYKPNARWAEAYQYLSELLG